MGTRSIVAIATALALMFAAPSLCSADEAKDAKAKAPKAKNIFAPKFATEFFAEENETQQPASSSTAAASSSSEAAKSSSSSQKAEAAPAVSALAQEKANGPVFVSSNPSEHILPPDQDPKVRINPEAPGPFVAMTDCYQRGDRDCAEKYARQFVRYLVKVIFEAKEITQMIGEAMVKEGVVDEEDWIGVEQYVDFELAQAREKTSSPVKPSHKEALERITADANGEAEIYYFFNLNCSYCRKMAPDVEWLWQVAKSDPKLKMVALTLGAEQKQWVDNYRAYTGLTIPILGGKKIADSFRIAFVPALVVVSPAGGVAYLRTGEQSFERMYQFVRKVQGRPLEFDETALRLASQKIGFENQGAETARAALSRVSADAKPAKEELGKF